MILPCFLFLTMFQSSRIFHVSCWLNITMFHHLLVSFNHHDIPIILFLLAQNPGEKSPKNPQRILKNPQKSPKGSPKITQKSAQNHPKIHTESPALHVASSKLFRCAKASQSSLARCRSCAFRGVDAESFVAAAPMALAIGGRRS